MANELALPYRTDWRELHNVLEYCKGKGADRGALEARFGAGENLRETLNALEQLDLIARNDSGDVRLSALGERLAYAPDATHRREWLTEALLGYAPYRFPLQRAAADGLRLLDAPWVEHLWQVDMRLGQPRNRVEEARTFFFRLADEAALGTYRRGVRGQTTRLELAPDIAERLSRAQAALAAAEADRAAAHPAQVAAVGSAARLAPSARQPRAAVGASPAPVTRAVVDDAVPVEAGGGQAVRVAANIATAARPGQPWSSGIAEPYQPGVTIAIQVDVTDWDIDKIAALLRLIGQPSDGA